MTMSARVEGGGHAACCNNSGKRPIMVHAQEMAMFNPLKPAG